ncbi:MAG: SDR family NAD(P)-dependent oxidoreductase, partial [Planctomycetota bacterium]
MRYADKVVLVTGGSKGIGEGIVRVFVGAGAKVVFCARGEKDGKSLEGQVNAKGPGSALFLPCDISKVDQVV